MRILHTNDSIVIEDCRYFDVQATLSCGQLFRYHQLTDNSYVVLSADKMCHISHNQDTVTITGSDREYWHRYFDLDTNYEHKCNVLMQQGDDNIQHICQVGKGIRILNQDLEETIISFIISANNMIPRIKNTVAKLSATLGTPIADGYYAFPTMQALADADIEVYNNAGCGFRGKYIKSSANMILNGAIDGIDTLDNDNARQLLTKLVGVGPKVANCILLFALSRGDVVPVDTWIKKVYHKYYEAQHKDRDISQYLSQLWGQNAGLMQQYMFYFERSVDKLGNIL